MSTPYKTAKDVLDSLGPAHDAQVFYLSVGESRVAIHGPDILNASLKSYFAEALDPDQNAQPNDITVSLRDGCALPQEPQWQDWSREPGKAGRKDAVYDMTDGRIIRKIRSGVTFLQTSHSAVAFGPLAANLSTTINFINTQVLNQCLRTGWSLCHAAAVTDGRYGLAIAGLSGGGKSTSILRMMDIDSVRFVSNDRVLVKSGTQCRALGIPKHPRINPGTILGNPRLNGMLDHNQKTQLSQMPIQDLWTLEDKHDLIIPDIYGPNRVQYDAPLTEFWVLNWDHASSAVTTLTEISLAERSDLLGALMKSPGPFYQHPDGHFEPNAASLNPSGYLNALKNVRICEISGRVDFDAVAQWGRNLFNA